MAENETDGVTRVLSTCENAHCAALRAFHHGDRDLPSLGYEDVFTPLRCHHSEGLQLVVRGRNGVDRYEWGSGDFIYYASDDRRTFKTAVDPFSVFNALDYKDVSVEVDS